jgi:F-type H+-transporting ATPase subunit alpha
MRKVAGPLRLNLAQFRELEAFAEFGSELDAVSLAQLDRGRRVVEVLKQGQYDPVPVEEQVLVIFGVTTGQMDDVSPADIASFEGDLREFARARYGSMLSGIADTGELPEDELTALITAFKDVWTPTSTTADAVGVAVAEEDESKAMRMNERDELVEEA